ncbi:MAG: iron-containing alcohol dehydrogenase [Alphaproteobacteria bacterium]|nr:iron-containing alcohol dehydrogenase [Alphaproteobacteria bacterium]
MSDIRFVQKIEMSEDVYTSLYNKINEIKQQDLKADNLIVIIADKFLKEKFEFSEFANKVKAEVFYYELGTEPTTDYINTMKFKILEKKRIAKCIIGIGGGSVLDSAKALSNILNNPGLSEDYQGWDLLKTPGVYKIGVPTLFGTGAETSRTCVLVNLKKNLKLGMNSPFTIFDELVIQPKLVMTAPESIRVMTALDGFFHAIEILDGKSRNIFADSFAEKSLDHFLKAIFVNNPLKEDALQNLALSSFYSGLALSNGMVGLVHPFSAALSVVYGIPHARANCFAMKALDDFYPTRKTIYWDVINRYNLDPQLNFNFPVSDSELEALCDATLVHSKPLSNYFGAKWETELTREVVKRIFVKITGKD